MEGLQTQRSPGKEREPKVNLLMQLDTPPCFLKKNLGGNSLGPCPGCCTCLCPNPPK